MELAIYRERLYPSVPFVLALSLSAPMVLLAALPFGLSVALPLGLFVPTLLISFAIFSSPTIDLSDGHLRAGRIRVPTKALGEVAELQKEEFSQLAGPGANPRARLVIRGDIKTGVSIQIVDEDDPTPYLLISSRRPSELAVALNAHRA